MFKVELKERWFDFDIVTVYRDIKEEMAPMKQWCLENFGKSVDNSEPSAVKYNWRCTNYVREVEEDGYTTMTVVYPVFFFRKEEQATWFSIRWANGN
jgi:hypothetical protein